LFAAVADAATKTWNGPADSYTHGWDYPENWLPFGLPGAGDDVVIAPSDNILRDIYYDYDGPAITLNSLRLALTGGPGGGLNQPMIFTQHLYDLSAITESVGNSNGVGNGVAIFMHTGSTNAIGSGGLSLGVGPTDMGTYVLSGGTATVAGSVYVGGSSSGAGGVGVLGVNEGTMTVNGTLVAYNTSDAFYGPTEINLNGGTINTAALNFNGTPSLLNWTGGTLNITNSVSFDSTAAGTTTGGAFASALTLGSGQTLKITGSETLGDTGSFDLTVNNGGTALATNSIDLGYSPTGVGTATISGAGSTLDAGNAIDVGVFGEGSLFVQAGGFAKATTNLIIGWVTGSTGQVNVSGANSKVQSGWGIVIGDQGEGTLAVNDGGTANALNWFSAGGSATGVGTVTVGGSGNPSTLSGAWGVVIGWNGKGNMTINAGGTATGATYLGFEATGEGTINLNTGGTLTAPGGTSVWVGGSYNGAGGKGILNVGGGTLTSTGPLVAFNTPGSKINFSSGTINTPVLNLNGTPSLLNWTGGTLNINNNVTFDLDAVGTTTGAAFGAALTLGTGKTLEITGDETLGSTGGFGLTINSGGMNTVTGVLRVNGELTVNSGGTATAQGYLLIGTGAGNVGEATVVGSNAILQSTTGTTVGDFAQGTLTIDNGGAHSALNWFVAGGGATGVGSVTVGGTGSPSTLSGAWGIVAGWAGKGTLTVNNGGTALGAIYLGFDPTGEGTINLNTGGTITTIPSGGASVWVGGSYNGAGGKGVLNVSGGTLTTTRSGFKTGER
jgi:T5SS/PEP-CTERM-associated repeat protein